MSEHDRLERQYDAMKAEQKAKALAGAFMQGWGRAKLHDEPLERAFESWRVCDEPDALAVDVMARKLKQIRNLAWACDGHSFDLILALCDEALAPIEARRVETPKDGSMRSTKAGNSSKTCRDTDNA